MFFRAFAKTPSLVVEQRTRKRKVIFRHRVLIELQARLL